MSRITFQKSIKALVALTLILSLTWNVVLLRDAEKLNLDSLKSAVKSLTFKYSDLVNGKIALINLKTNLPEGAHKLTEIDNAIFRDVISQAAKHYSIFGLEPSEGFNGLPKGLPKWVAKCGPKLGLDKKLYFVSYSRTPKSQYIFFRGDSALTALTGSILEQNRCRVVSEITIQKSSMSWLIKQQTKFDLSPNDLPAHFSMSNNGVAVLVSRSGEIHYINFENEKIGITSAQDLGLSLSQSQPHTHFGVKSVLLGNDHLYIAVAKNDNACNRLEIYSLPIQKRKVDIDPGHRDTIYKSPGCFNAATVELNAIGGRLVFSDASQSEIVFSLGNAEIWTGLEEIPSKKQFGAIIKLNLFEKNSRTISTGHRNPQGLCVKSKTIFETEQGPDGGDEFNLIKEGKNYGWPNESYGAPYGDFFSTEKTKRQFGSHSQNTKPLLSWVPAVAIGDLICPNITNSSPWKDDFIAATLKDKSLRRLVLDEGTVRVDERIPMNERIRDIQFNSAGNLISLTDSGAIIALHFVPRKIQ